MYYFKDCLTTLCVERAKVFFKDVNIHNCQSIVSTALHSPLQTVCKNKLKPFSESGVKISYQTLKRKMSTEGRKSGGRRVKAVRARKSSRGDRRSLCARGREDRRVTSSLCCAVTPGCPAACWCLQQPPLAPQSHALECQPTALTQPEADETWSYPEHH
jgi:hypothetical protein